MKAKKTEQVCVGFTVCVFPYASDKNQSLSFISLILSTLAHFYAYRIMYNETENNMREKREITALYFETI